jgi:aconitate hydratase
LVVKLTGKLNGWTAPKDVILKVAGILTVKGGTDAVVEYFGEGATSMSCTGKEQFVTWVLKLVLPLLLLVMMKSMARYLKATGRADVAELANTVKEHLTG